MMKNTAIFKSLACALALLLCIYSNGQNAAPSSIKVLAIGNSFSADAVEQELYGLLDAAGCKEIIIGDMYIGGCPLVKHAANAKADSAAYSYRKIVDGVMTKTEGVKLSDALKDEMWDFVSIQEGAGFHGYYNTVHNGISHSMEPDLTYLIDYVRAGCANKDFKLIYHVPWVAKAGYGGKKFSYYDFDQQLMYSMICDATRQVLEAHSGIDMCMNTVDAIQNARTSFIGDNMTRDGWHLSFTAGRYTSGCLWCEKLTGQSVTGNSYRPSYVAADVAAVCREAAHQAASHPFTTADLSYFKRSSDERLLSEIPCKGDLSGDLYVPSGFGDDCQIAVLLQESEEDMSRTVSSLKDKGCAVFNVRGKSGAGRTDWDGFVKECSGAALFVLDGGLAENGIKPGAVWLVGISENNRTGLWQAVRSSDGKGIVLHEQKSVLSTLTVE